jgi:hypothetical protein
MAPAVNLAMRVRPRAVPRLFSQRSRPGRAGYRPERGLQGVRRALRADSGRLQGAPGRGAPDRVPPRSGSAAAPPVPPRGRCRPAGRSSVLERVKERAVGAKVTQQLSPAQEVTRIVRDELMALLGGEAGARLAGNPRSSPRRAPGLADPSRTSRAPPEDAGRCPLVVAVTRPAAVERSGARPPDRRTRFEPGNRTDPVDRTRGREARQTCGTVITTPRAGFTRRGA